MMKVTFKKTEEDTVRLAIFLSEIVRQGVRVEVREDDYSVEVTLTGGF